MNIGIVCYASIGGSGIIATELGKALAARGHGVHILSSDMPVRLGDYQPGLSFHRVETPSYPLFREPQYLLSLANKIVQVSRDEQLDIVHAHYAIPHATAAYLARQILASTPGGVVPRVITTLHGTDITLLGSDPSVLGDRRVLHPAVRRRHGRVREPQGRHVSRARRDVRHPGHPELHRLRRVHSPPRRRDAARAARAGTARSCSSTSRTSGRSSASTAVVEVFARVRQRGARPAADGRRRAGSAPRRRGWRARSASPTTSSSSANRIRSCRCCRCRTSSCCRRRRRASGWRRSRRWPARCRSSRRASGGLPEVIERRRQRLPARRDDLDGMAQSVVRLLNDEALHARVAEAARPSRDDALLRRPHRARLRGVSTKKSSHEARQLASQRRRKADLHIHGVSDPESAWLV